MSKRIEQVNSLIQKKLGEIILKEIEFPAGVLTTLTRVKTSANLIDAKVYISVFPSDKTGQVLTILNKMVYELQKILNKQFKMRPVPKIRFVEERQTEEAAKIEELLKTIEKTQKGG